eukprot:gene2147-biopygen1912
MRDFAMRACGGSAGSSPHTAHFRSLWRLVKVAKEAAKHAARLEQRGEVPCCDAVRRVLGAMSRQPLRCIVHLPCTLGFHGFRIANPPPLQSDTAGGAPAPPRAMRERGRVNPTPLQTVYVLLWVNSCRGSPGFAGLGKTNTGCMDKLWFMYQPPGSI